MTPEQRERLPAYARRYMEHLEREVRSLSTEIRQRDGDFEGHWAGAPRIFAQTVLEEERPVGTKADRIRFYSEDGKTWIDVSTRRKGEGIEVRSWEPLVLSPVAANVVEIRSVDR